MSDEYKFKCLCGRTVRVFVEKGKLKHEIKGTGDAILDALEGEEDSKEGEPDAGK